MSQSDHFASVQVARALAALAVLCAHVGDVPNAMGIAVYTHGLFAFGQAGVDLFFVISGFILAAVTARPQTPARFVARRLVRILPFYWLFTALWLALHPLFGLALPDGGYLLRSLLLVPQDPVPVLGVGWSLEHEFIFYALVAALLAWGHGARLPLLLGVITALSLALHLLTPTAVDSGAPLHLLSLYHVQFLAGVLLYRWRDRVARLRPTWLLLSGAIAFPVGAAVLHLLHGATVPAQPTGLFGMVRVLLWGGAATLLLAGLLACEGRQPALFRSRPARALGVVGGASYALYLSHPIVFSLTGLLLGGWWPAAAPAWLAEAIAILAAIGFALLAWRWVERPLLAWLNAPSASRTSWRRVEQRS